MNRRSFLTAASSVPLIGVSPAVTRPIGLIRMEAGTFHSGGLSESPHVDYRGAVGIRVLFNNGTATKWFAYNSQVLGSNNRGGANAVEVCVWSTSAMRAITDIPFDPSVIETVNQIKEAEWKIKKEKIDAEHIRWLRERYSF